MFLIYKEALHNIAKHAQAEAVEIRVVARDGVLEVLIEDEGVGIGAFGRRPGHGLASMQRRAEQIGGTLEVQRKPDKGTRVHLVARIA